MRPRMMIPQLVGGCLWGLLFLCSNEVQAEQAAPSTTQAVDNTSEKESSPSVMEMILESGPTGWVFMGVLGLFSLGGGMVAIERAFGTRRKALVPREFLKEMDRLARIHETRPEPWRLLCTQWDAPISHILHAGLLRFGRPLPEVEKSMEDAAAREMAGVRSGIRPLNTVGSIAPLVGLLGTVVGMIGAFQSASTAGLGDKGQSLAEGIYLALLTTAAGLAIAIPALLLAAYFNAKVEKIFRTIDQHLMQTMPTFAAMEIQADSDSGADHRGDDHPRRQKSPAASTPRIS